MTNASDPRRQSDSSILLDGSSTSSYWIGFLFADGYINHDRMACKLTLGLRDCDHAERFARYVRSRASKARINVTVGFQDKHVVSRLIEIWDFKPRKTLNPPSLDHIERDEASTLSFICGFYDGDGCTAKKGHGIVKCHAAWLPVLAWMNDYLNERIRGVKRHRPYINRQGYAFWTLSKRQMAVLKNHGIASYLPLLNRKWDGVLTESKWCTATEKSDKLRVKRHEERYYNVS